jgi:hypothetical protein
MPPKPELSSHERKQIVQQLLLQAKPDTQPVELKRGAIKSVANDFNVRFQRPMKTQQMWRVQPRRTTSRINNDVVSYILLKYIYIYCVWTSLQVKNVDFLPGATQKCWKVTVKWPVFAKKEGLLFRNGGSTSLGGRDKLSIIKSRLLGHWSLIEDTR